MGLWRLMGHRARLTLIGRPWRLRCRPVASIHPVSGPSGRPRRQEVWAAAPHPEVIVGGLFSRRSQRLWLGLDGVSPGRLAWPTLHGG